MKKRGSALVATIWTLAVLSILIVSYAMDAHLQSRINLYLRERVQMDHLTAVGRVIAEVILLDYKNVEDITGKNMSQSDLDDLKEKDRWYGEKVDLKSKGEMFTHAIPVDALHPECGSVSVHIKPIEGHWNINLLYAGGDPNFDKIWDHVFNVVGLVGDDDRIDKIRDGIVNSWCDWRDEDSNQTGDSGAEDDFYKQAYKEFQDHEDRPDSKEYQLNQNYRARCRNGPIPNLDELKALRGFNVYDEDKPLSADAILDGGVINPSEPEEDQIVVKYGLRKYFSVYGSGKINVNEASADVLATVPGIMQSDANTSSYAIQENITNALELAQAIVEVREIGDNRSLVERSQTSHDQDEMGNFTDFNNLKERLDDNHKAGNDYIQQEASEYLIYQPEKFFEIEITGRGQYVTRTVKIIAKIENDKITYIRWEEQ